MAFISLMTVLLLFPVITSLYIRKRLETSGKASIGNVTISVFNRSLVIKNLKAEHVRMDTSYTLSGTVAEICFNGIDFRFWSGDDVINIEKLKFKNAIIDARYDPHPELRDIADRSIKLGMVQTIEFSDASIDFINKNGDHLISKKINVEISPFKADRFEENQKFKISCSRTLFQTSDSLYEISLKEFSGDSEKQLINIDSIRVRPLFEDAEFARRKRYQSDRFDIVIPDMKIVLHPYHSNDTLKVKKILLSEINLDAYRDRRIPRKRGEKYKSLQNYLGEFLHPLLIDSILVSNGVIRYREHAEKNNETGTLEFNKISVNLSHLCAGMASPDSALQVEFQSDFMNSGLLKGVIAFPYNSQLITCKGNLVKMPFMEINRISEPAAGIVFSNGWINVMKFDFTADQNYSKGNLEIQYTNLDFSIRGQPEGDTTGFISKAITSVASLFVKKESKESNEKVALKGSICQLHRNDRFVFNYMWKSILSGLRSAMVKSFGPVGDGKKETLPC